MVTISLGQAVLAAGMFAAARSCGFSNPRLTVAIKLAREWARVQHGLPGHPVRVEMAGVRNRLTRRGQGGSSRAAVALAS